MPHLQALGPLIGTLSSKVGWRVRRLDALQDGVNGEAASIATEALVAASTIKGFRQEPAFAGRHAAKVWPQCAPRGVCCRCVSLFL